MLCLNPSAQSPVLNKQRHFRKNVPAGNYSGIAWLGADRYAIVNDKSATAGFRLLTEFRTSFNLTKRSLANYEGIYAGPRLTDGRLLLLLVADSQSQYKGRLKDWFKTVVISDHDLP